MMKRQMDNCSEREIFGAIGAGIAGLSASLYIAKLGMKTHIFEKRRDTDSGGVGIQLTPNALYSLAPLNVLDDLIAESFFPEKLIVSDAHLTGELNSIQLKGKMEHKFGFPYLTSSRDSLHKILLKRANNDSLIKISFNSKIISTKNEDAVICKTENGKNLFFCNTLICNGITSNLTNNDSSIRLTFSDTKVLRTCLSGKDLPQDILKNINLWMGKSFHVVSYPINNKSDLNVVLVKKNRRPLGGKKNLENELFNPRLLSVQNKNLAHLLKDITSWSVWPLHRTGIITRTKKIYSQNSLYIGDAAHPLYPHLAQGAALALEDSYTLYKLLHKHRRDNVHISKVFQKFAELRIRRYQRMQIESRINGKVFQQHGLFRIVRNILLKNFGPRLMEKDWIYENKNFNRI